MTDDDDRKKTAHPTTWLGATLLFLILYLLSIGPAILLWHTYPKTRDLLDIIYAPVRTLTYTPLRHPIERYTNWWFLRSGAIPRLK